MCRMDKKRMGLCDRCAMERESRSPNVRGRLAFCFCLCYTVRVKQGCTYNHMVVHASNLKKRGEKMEHPARKITKIAREAEHIVLLACGRTRSARQKSTAFMRCAIIRASHRRNWPACCMPDQARHRPPNGQPGAKGLPSPGAESGRRPQSAALCHAAGRRSAQRKGRNGERFLRLSDGWSQRKRPRDVFKPARRGLSPLQSGKPRGLPTSERRIKGKNE